jgi:hypothetical protein
MRRVVKVKALATGVPLRRAAVSSSAASRRNFPAWIAAEDSGSSFSARAAIPRVRDGLVLRAVGNKKSANPKGPSHGSGAR